MEWTAIVGDFRYVSASLSTSSSEFAELLHERNGFVPGCRLKTTARRQDALVVYLEML